MWKLLSFLILIFSPLSVRADLIHRLSTSTQLNVGGASTTSERIGSTYAVSGSNIKVASSDDHFGKILAPSNNAAATLDPGTYDINTAGSAFTFSESYTSGDSVNTIGSGVDVTAHTYTAATTDNNGNTTAPAINSYGTIMDLPAYGDVTSSSGGHAGSLAGTIATDGAISLTAGGAGTTATGQVITTLQIN